MNKEVSPKTYHIKTVEVKTSDLVDFVWVMVTGVYALSSMKREVGRVGLFLTTNAELKKNKPKGRAIGVTISPEVTDELLPNFKEGVKTLIDTELRPSLGGVVLLTTPNETIKIKLT